jgi:hemolysin III
MPDGVARENSPIDVHQITESSPMIAEADLAFAESPSTFRAPKSSGLVYLSSRVPKRAQSGAMLPTQEKLLASSACVQDFEAADRYESIEVQVDDDSWLLSPEANGAGLSWSAAGGLGADLGRSEPVIQDQAEELANTVTHGLGLVLSLAGLYALVVIAGMGIGPGTAAGCAVYGASMVFLYAASTFYHAFRAGPGKRVLLLFDYIGIYLLIAGTYTPMVLINMGTRNPVGWSLLAAVWGIAAVGTGCKISRFNRFEGDSSLPYLVMSGAWLVAFRETIAAVPPMEFLWLLAGGAFYLGGFGFYARAERRFFHAVWHALVLAGSICHFRAVVGCVAAIAGSGPFA